MKKFLRILIIVAIVILVISYIYYKKDYNGKKIQINHRKNFIIDIIKPNNTKPNNLTQNNIEQNNEETNNLRTIFVEYKPGNITYIDSNGKEFTGIGTITLHYGNKDIIMLDRNLGATTNDINDTNSYGYYFQRGNNYGFSLNTGNIKTEKKLIDISGYGPSEYNNPTFIMGEYGERMLDHYTNGKNLWGGGNDNNENGRGLKLNTNIKQRKGPCPNGYHIPSIGEWNLLVEYRINSYTGTWQNKECIFKDNNGFTKISSNYQCNNEKAVNKFLNDFKLPQAGHLIYRNLYHTPSGISLWTSTFRYKIRLTESSIRPMQENTYANAMSIRCFSDTN